MRAVAQRDEGLLPPLLRLVQLAIGIEPRKEQSLDDSVEKIMFGTSVTRVSSFSDWIKQSMIGN